MKERTSLLVALLALAGTLAFAQEEAAETEESGYEYQEESAVFAALESILSQPEFERLKTKPEKPPEEPSSNPAWLDRLIDRIGDALGSDADPEASESSGFYVPGIELLLYAMAAIILGVAVFFILKSVFRASRDQRIAQEEEEARVFRAGAAPGEVPPEEYWRRAVEHGERKRYKEALRELLLGAMSSVERRGGIRFRRGLTNRDYYYAVRGAVRESFGLIASRFEHVYFGRREATADSFRDCCREYQKSFRQEPA